MAGINYKRAMPGGVARFRRWYKARISQSAAEVAGLVLRSADIDGQVPRRRAGVLSDEAMQVIDRVFTLNGQRETVREDGTPVSLYARALMTEIAKVTRDVVRGHGRYLETRMPDDLKAWFATSITPPHPQRGEQSFKPETRTPGTFIRGGGDDIVSEQFEQRQGESDEAYRERLERLRIFAPNPYAEYEPAHQWVDPRGYRLSDRIWRTDQETRRGLDALLSTGIREGWGAERMAREVERWLIPGREKIRTNPYAPYGQDGSYDAMRLARTEIARAANQAAYISALRNPYVNRLEVVRSANGDPKCPVCPMHATIGIGGERLRAPYSVHAANVPVYHPHCMCRVEPVVVDDAATVTANLREVMEGARDELTPVMTPLQIAGFTQALLGDPVYRLILQNTPLQPGMFP